MQASDYALICGEVSVLTDRSGSNLEWSKKFCIVTQEALIVYKRKNFTEPEDFKILLKGAQVLSFAADSLGFVNATLIELVLTNKRRALIVDSSLTPKEWVYYLTFSACWSNYEGFCRFHKLNPKTYLLKWGETRQTRLVTDFTTAHQYATIEFLRRNTCVTDLQAENLNHHYDVLVKVLRCFLPTQLLSLGLCSAKLKDDNFASLINAIVANCHLQKLDLSRNFLSVKSVNLLLKVSHQIPFLKVLCLNENPLYDAAVALLLPNIFKTLDLAELDLTSCNLTNESSVVLNRTLRIPNLPLEIFKLNDNKFSSETKAQIMRTLSTLRARGSTLRIELNPVSIEPELLVLNPSCDISLIRTREITSKSTEGPKLVKSNTLAKISSRVQQLTNADNFTEDLRKLAAELVRLETQHSKANMRELQDVICDKLDQAIASDDFYYIETLYNAAKSLGIRHKPAEAKLDELKLQCLSIVEQLHFVLNPRNYKKATLTEVNTKLDSALNHAKRIGLRGELVTAAMTLVNLRTQILNNES